MSRRKSRRTELVEGAKAVICAGVLMLYFYFRGDWGNTIRELVSKPLFMILGPLFLLYGAGFLIFMVVKAGLKRSLRSGLVARFVCVPLLTLGIIMLLFEWFGLSIRYGQLGLLVRNWQALALGLALTGVGLLVWRSGKTA